MKIPFDNIIDEFYEKYKDTELKGYSHKAISNVVKSPFKRLKEIMRKGLFKEVRFNYFGVFRIREFQVRKKIELYEGFYEDNKDHRYKGPFFLNIVDTMKNYIKQLEERRDD